MLLAGQIASIVYRQPLCNGAELPQLHRIFLCSRRSYPRRRTSYCASLPFRSAVSATCNVPFYLAGGEERMQCESTLLAAVIFLTITLAEDASCSVAN